MKSPIVSDANGGVKGVKGGENVSGLKEAHAAQHLLYPIN